MVDPVLEVIFAGGTSCSCCDSNEAAAELAVEAMARVPEAQWPPLDPLPPAFAMARWQADGIPGRVKYARERIAAAATPANVVDLAPPVDVDLELSTRELVRDLIPMLEGRPLMAAFLAVKSIATQLRSQMVSAEDSGIFLDDLKARFRS